MKSLKDKIQGLALRAGELEPGEEERDRLLKQVQNFTNSFLNTLPVSKAYSPGKASLARIAVDDRKKSLEKILEVLSEEVLAKGIKPASEGHLGYIPGGGIYASALGDYLAAVTNEYAGISFASPGAVAMEQELLNWMKRIFEFPDSAIGNLTSGGSIANLIALTAARDRHQVKGTSIEKKVVYLSEQVHHCIFKALRIIGLEDVQISKIRLDTNSKIDPRDLETKIQEDIEKGLEPFLVIASAGTTDTGAVDPLDRIGKIAEQFGLWYHIDAAYGGFFVLCENRRTLFSGIEMADSLAVDPHKALFLPFGLGAVLIKDKAAVLHSHHYTANYMQDAIDEAYAEPADLSPELTKHFRALRLWLPLQLYGIQPFKAALEEKLLLTRYFREELKTRGYRLGPSPDLTVSYFWWPLSDPDQQNEFNRALMKEVHKDGAVFLSSTTIRGNFVIRMAILSFRTHLQTIDKAVSMLERSRKKLGCP